jgi:hypothetical protein
MKTTIELPDDLLECSSRGTAREVRAQGTHQGRPAPGAAFAPRKRGALFAVHPFLGDGLTLEFAGAGWDGARDEIYRDRG